MKKYNEQEENMQQGGGFMDMKVKEATVRIVSGFSNFHQHYIENSGSLICVGEDRGCTECKAGNRPGFRSFVWVIDRDEPEEDKQLKIMPCGWTVHMQIVRLAKGTITQFNRPEGKPLEMEKESVESPKHAFDEMPGYDIKILRTLVTDNNMDTRYEVVPQKPSELTGEELDVINKKVTDLDLIIKKMEDKVTNPSKIEGAEDIDKLEYPKDENVGEIPF